MINANNDLYRQNMAINNRGFNGSAMIPRAPTISDTGAQGGGTKQANDFRSLLALVILAEIDRMFSKAMKQTQSGSQQQNPTNRNDPLAGMMREFMGSPFDVLKKLSGGGSNSNKSPEPAAHRSSKSDTQSEAQPSKKSSKTGSKSLKIGDTNIADFAKNISANLKHENFVHLVGPEQTIQKGKDPNSALNRGILDNTQGVAGKLSYKHSSFAKNHNEIEADLAKGGKHPPLDLSKPPEKENIKLNIQGHHSDGMHGKGVEVYDRRAKEWVRVGVVDGKGSQEINFDYDKSMGPPVYRTVQVDRMGLENDWAKNGREGEKKHSDKWSNFQQNKWLKARVDVDHKSVKGVETLESAANGGEIKRTFKGDAYGKSGTFDDMTFTETRSKPAKRDENGEVIKDKKHYRKVSAEISANNPGRNEDVDVQVYDAEKKEWKLLAEFRKDDDARRTQHVSFVHYTGETEEPQYRFVKPGTNNVVRNADEMFKTIENTFDEGKDQRTRRMNVETDANDKARYNDFSITERVESEGIKSSSGLIVGLMTKEGQGTSEALKGFLSFVFGVDMPDLVTEDDFKLEYKNDKGQWTTIAERGKGKDAEAKGINETHEIPRTADGKVPEMRLSTGGQTFNLNEIADGEFKARENAKVDPIAMAMNIAAIATAPFTGGGSLAAVGSTAARFIGKAAASAAAKSLAKAGLTAGSSVAKRKAAEVAARQAATKAAKDAAKFAATREGAKAIGKEVGKEAGKEAAGNVSSAGMQEAFREGATVAVHESTAHADSTTYEFSGTEGDDVGATVVLGQYETKAK